MPTLERMGSRRQRTLGIVGLVVGLVLLVAAIVTALHGRSTKSQPTSPRAVSTATRTPFAANSIWNAPLPPTAPIAANSSALVGQLELQVSGDGTWINTWSYSTPIYTVGRSQPRVPVMLDMSPSNSSAALLAQVFRAGVPIPSGARPASGTDADLVVWQPSTDTVWELWNTRLIGSTWHARWGGRMENVSRNPGYFTNPADWGTAATSLALLGGTIRISDLRAGHIDHALAISIPEARAGVVAWPAQRTDGKLNSPDAIPEGTRFRLDPKLDLAKLGLPPVTRMIAEAAQRYGLFVRDQSGAVVFYAEQPTSAQQDPYSGPNSVFGTLSPKQLTAAFPWSHLEVVSAPVHAYH